MKKQLNFLPEIISLEDMMEVKGGITDPSTSSDDIIIRCEPGPAVSCNPGNAVSK